MRFNVDHSKSLRNITIVVVVCRLGDRQQHSRDYFVRQQHALTEYLQYRGPPDL